jgi:ribonuclease-3
VREQRSRLCQRLGFEFSDEHLLEQALTHRSAERTHNERLEFLGDSVLNFLVADALYRRFPESREGELTRLRARLVRGESLAAFARELDLGVYLNLGAGELKSGGRQRDSILADAFEAVIGAVYLDAGLESCRECLQGIMGGKLEELEGDSAQKDPKTRLQEFLQGRHQLLPIYTITDTQGVDHEQAFTVQCTLPGLDTTTFGGGLNRRSAEQDAAQKALELIEQENLGQ